MEYGDSEDGSNRVFIYLSSSCARETTARLPVGCARSVLYIHRLTVGVLARCAPDVRVIVVIIIMSVLAGTRTGTRGVRVDGNCRYLVSQYYSQYLR